MKATALEIELADKMYFDNVFLHMEIKDIAKKYNRKKTVKFYNLLSIGCERFLSI